MADATSVYAAAKKNSIVVFQGLNVKIDRPVGTVQHGVDKQGKPWTRVYKVPYGELPRTQGGDGEALDVFLGPHKDATKAYLVVQRKDDGTFDEFKLLLGFESAAAAKTTYLAHVPAKFFAGMLELPVSLIQGLLNKPPDHTLEKKAHETLQALALHFRVASTETSHLLGSRT